MEMPNIANVGALIGDPVRAAMIGALMDGSERPAGELAYMAGASAQAASAHLAKLVSGGILRVRSQGRHRFYALRDSEIAHAIEALAVTVDQCREPATHRDPRLRRARRCYDHVAGALGVALCDRLIAMGHVAAGGEGYQLTETGRTWFGGLGVDGTPPPRRPAIRPCLDWTERRPHLAGWYGAALCRLLEDRRLVHRDENSRVLQVTPKGRLFLSEHFRLEWR
ncbi:MAG: helix-turn-helix transcriptional regulator [Pseudomonadota bacterium]|nr:helix-turn-helix transcriptional regulator [Pseudomonadota bacterium]